MTLLLCAWISLTASAAQDTGKAAAKPAPAAAAPVRAAAWRTASLLAAGTVGVSVLRQHSYIGQKPVSKNQDAAVYNGLHAPIFQTVIWGKDHEKPDRVLIEFDPKKQSLEDLKAFSEDWNKHFKPEDAQDSVLDAFAAGTATHLKEYCALLPAGASCRVQMWETAGARILRADIHLKVGPSVPKAIEYARKAAKPAGTR